MKCPVMIPTSASEGGLVGVGAVCLQSYSLLRVGRAWTCRMCERSPENWVAVMVPFPGPGEMGGWSRKCRKDEPGE